MNSRKNNLHKKTLFIKFQIPRRRRSKILETLREYEEEAEKASPEPPGSPCSSEELNTPLLKRIAKKLFKVNTLYFRHSMHL